jgi:hypothetical protein
MMDEISLRNMQGMVLLSSKSSWQSGRADTASKTTRRDIGAGASYSNGGGKQKVATASPCVKEGHRQPDVMVEACILMRRFVVFGRK